MNYKIITDLKLLQKFVDWLPDLEKNQGYYICLFARSKYSKEIAHISSDKQQLNRDVITNKDKIIKKIKLLETEIGSYFQYRNGVFTPIPQEALAIYINPVRRDLLKANKKLIHKLIDCSFNNVGSGFNPLQECYSAIQTESIKKDILDFDFDIPFTEELNDMFLSILDKNSYKILITRGGFHLLVSPKQTNKKFYQEIIKIGSVDPQSISDSMIPIPGTYQGGFTPHFIEDSDYIKVMSNLKKISIIDYDRIYTTNIILHDWLFMSYNMGRKNKSYYGFVNSYSDIEVPFNFDEHMNILKIYNFTHIHEIQS